MLTALALTTIAGLATILGSLIALSERAREPKALGAALAFAAGAMLTVSALELLPHSIGVLGAGTTTLYCVAGLVIVGALDLASRAWERRAVTSAREAPQPSDSSSARALLRTGLITALALTAHNIPEGFATFSSALQDTVFALPLAAAIALHNVPEGVAVAAPHPPRDRVTHEGHRRDSALGAVRTGRSPRALRAPHRHGARREPRMGKPPHRRGDDRDQRARAPPPRLHAHPARANPHVVRCRCACHGREPMGARRLSARFAPRRRLVRLRSS